MKGLRVKELFSLGEQFQAIIEEDCIKQWRKFLLEEMQAITPKLLQPNIVDMGMVMYLRGQIAGLAKAKDYPVLLIKRMLLERQKLAEKEQKEQKKRVSKVKREEGQIEKRKELVQKLKGGE